KKKGRKDQSLQAVVLTDSYQRRFLPLSSEKPRCLLPLANIPVIEYTLEFLASCQVREVFLVCSAHADLIRSYIKDSSWSKPSSPFFVNIIKSSESRSVGDAMRDIDSKAIIDSDFLLITGDVVANIPFDGILDAHRARRAADPNAIMTSITRKVSATHHTRAIAETGTFVVSKPSNRVLMYQPNKVFEASSQKVCIDKDILDECKDGQLGIHNDLIDCQIDICSPDVPVLFTDNFDYEDLRKDFVRGVLTSDLLGKTIYIHTVDDHYAARVCNFSTYKELARNILGRWTYPMVPDSNSFRNVPTSFKYRRGNKYIESDVSIGRYCDIGYETLIGAGTTLGPNSSVSSSCVGRRCSIGENTRITNSFLFSDVTVGRHSNIEGAIVADGAAIGDNCLIPSGCIVSFGVKLPDNTKLNPGTKLTAVSTFRSTYRSASHGLSSEEDSSDTYESDSDDLSLSNDLFDDSDAESDHPIVHSRTHSTGSYQKVQTRLRTRRSSINSQVSGLSGSDIDDGSESKFEREARASIDRAVSNNHGVDVAKLELTTLRLAMNAPYTKVRRATADVLVKHVELLISKESIPLTAAVQKIFGEYGPMFSKQVFNDADRLDLLYSLAEACLMRGNENGSAILMHASMLLYDEDILPEHVILAWWRDVSKFDDYKSLLAGMKTFIDWLQTAEEEND
ncbi:hypothetical protein CANCADRAFT_15132, partial [Tortispora caseinolytica NRRL Y-17796]